MDSFHSCWCGSGLSYKKCHASFDRTWEYLRLRGAHLPDRGLIKNSLQIDGIRQSCRVNIDVLDSIAEMIRPGITTEDINRLVDEKTRESGGIPAPLNYEGFPKSVCTSVNHEVCHGIPSSEKVLKDGDIVNVDVSTIVNGFYSDSSRMFLVGNVSLEWQRLCLVTKECVRRGLREVKPWTPLGNIGQAVQDYALENGYTVVCQIGGHGIGLAFHEDPYVSFVSKKNTGVLMAPGMVFTIEPMVNMGSDKIQVDPSNGWTVTTKDGKPSAQWEVQVLVTETGHELLAW